MRSLLKFCLWFPLTIILAWGCSLTGREKLVEKKDSTPPQMLVRDKEDEQEEKVVKKYLPSIVGIEGVVDGKPNEKGTGFIVAYDDENNIIYIVTQAHVVRGDKCPQINFGQVSIRAFHQHLGENYGSATKENALALLSVEPNFSRKLSKLRLGTSCGYIKSAITFNHDNKYATASASNQHGETCDFSGRFGIESGYSGAPLIDDTTSEIVGVISEVDSGTVKVVSGETVRKFIRDEVKPASLRNSIIELMEKSDNTFTTSSTTKYSCTREVATPPMGLNPTPSNTTENTTSTGKQAPLPVDSFVKCSNKDRVEFEMCQCAEDASSFSDSFEELKKLHQEGNRINKQDVHVIEQIYSRMRNCPQQEQFKSFLDFLQRYSY